MRKKYKLEFSNKKRKKSKLIGVCVGLVIVAALCVLTAVAIKYGIANRETLPTDKPTQSTSESTTESVPETVFTASNEGVTDTPKEIFNCSASCAGLFDLSQPSVLYAKHINRKISPASLVKILTCCVALEYSSADEVFTVGSELDLVKKGSSLCLINKGQQLKLYDLMCGMLLSSGNDASYTVAVNTARKASDNSAMNDSDSIAYFIKLMNKYAKNLGAKRSNFTNPDGWDDENQYSTVYDLYLIARKALENKDIKEIVSLPEKYALFVSGQHITWKNTNRLLIKGDEYFYEGASGVKTGTTKSAGLCLIASAEKDGRELLSIIVGCENDDVRYKTAIKLFDYGFAQTNTETQENNEK